MNGLKLGNQASLQTQANAIKTITRKQKKTKTETF